MREKVIILFINPTKNLVSLDKVQNEFKKQNPNITCYKFEKTDKLHFKAEMSKLQISSIKSLDLKVGQVSFKLIKKEKKLDEKKLLETKIDEPPKECLGVVVIGNIGVGKSSFGNLLFGTEHLKVGVIKKVTCDKDFKSIADFKHPKKDLYIFDCEGYESSNNTKERIGQFCEITKKIEEKQRIHKIFYCIKATEKVDDGMIEFVNKIYEKKPTLLSIVITHCDLRAVPKIDNLKNHLLKKNKKFSIYVTSNKKGVSCIRSYSSICERKCLNHTPENYEIDQKIVRDKWYCKGCDTKFSMCQYDCKRPRVSYNTWDDNWQCQTCNNIWKIKTYPSEHESILLDITNNKIKLINEWKDRVNKLEKEKQKKQDEMTKELTTISSKFSEMEKNMNKMLYVGKITPETYEKIIEKGKEKKIEDENKIKKKYEEFLTEIQAGIDEAKALRKQEEQEFQAWRSNMESSLKIRIGISVPIIITASVSAALVGAIPIPYSDVALLVPVQLLLFSSLGITWLRFDELKRLDRGILFTMFKGILGSLSVAGFGGLGYLIGTNLKWIPVVGSVAGGILNASIATSMTLAIGVILILAFHQLSKDLDKGIVKDGINEAVIQKYVESIPKEGIWKRIRNGEPIQEILNDLLK